MWVFKKLLFNVLKHVTTVLFNAHIITNVVGGGCVHLSNLILFPFLSEMILLRHINLRIFEVCSLICFDICLHSWSHHCIQDKEHIHSPCSLPSSLHFPQSSADLPSVTAHLFAFSRVVSNNVVAVLLSLVPFARHNCFKASLGYSMHQVVPLTLFLSWIDLHYVYIQCDCPGVDFQTDIWSCLGLFQSGGCYEHLCRPLYGYRLPFIFGQKRRNEWLHGFLTTEKTRGHHFPSIEQV